MSLADYEETTCSCQECVNMCLRHPCWPTPDEAKAIIDAGFGSRLMLDYWVDPTRDIYILSPAFEGYEGRTAPFFERKRCTFLTQDNRCELHDLGLKPIEGRIASCTLPKDTPLHAEVMATWDNDEAQALAEAW